MEVLGVPPELQARFLLEAAGYDEDAIREALASAGDARVLHEGETIAIRRGSLGWEIVSSSPE